MPRSRSLARPWGRASGCALRRSTSSTKWLAARREGETRQNSINKNNQSLARTFFDRVDRRWAPRQSDPRKPRRPLKFMFMLFCCFAVWGLAGSGFSRAAAFATCRCVRCPGLGAEPTALDAVANAFSRNSVI
eukprot:9481277-Pyramimonas_sp.AAC.1